MARKRQRSRWEEDNELSLNPWAFAAVAAIVGGVAGLAVLLALLG